MVLTGSMTFHLSGNCEVDKSALLYATPTQGGQRLGGAGDQTHSPRYHEGNQISLEATPF